VQPEVVIEVSGGVVQAVYTNRDIKVILVDWDNIEQGDRGAVFRADRASTMSEVLQDELAGAE